MRRPTRTKPALQHLHHRFINCSLMAGLSFPRFFQTTPRGDAPALRYDFTPIRLSKGLLPPKLWNPRHTRKRPARLSGRTGLESNPRQPRGVDEVAPYQKMNFADRNSVRALLGNTRSGW